MSRYDKTWYLFMTFLAVYLGAIELRRVWMFQFRGEKTYHRLYLKELERLGREYGKAEQEAYRKKLEANWWVYQGRDSIIFGIPATLGGIVMAIYIIVNF